MDLTSDCGAQVRRRQDQSGCRCALKWKRQKNTGCVIVSRPVSDHSAMEHTNNLTFRLQLNKPDYEWTAEDRDA